MKAGLYRRCGKRMLDLALSLAGLLLFSPLLLVIAILVKSSSAGPVWYRHRRVGRGGRPVGVVKFRTMCRNADRVGPAITSAADFRITPLGRHLRRLKLDELPQLWNVLVGEMSLVGPRPEAPGYVELYSPAQRKVLSVRPGITDSASIAYRREEDLLAGCVGLGRVARGRADIAQSSPLQASLSEAELAGRGVDCYYREIILPDKLEMNLRYLDRISLTHDLVLLFRTAIAIFTPRLYAIHEDHSSR